ncbi:MAG: HAD family hydrolase [Melioribacteraceae bacterium]|jgi:phosphoglycolate phosphatase-like HAD superfamily hydrolase|nr:HAD family hydrolase [Melioribacteraceae bacterium]
MKNLLCLDFDGVICDSIKECLLITYNSYHELNGENEKLVDSIDEISQAVIEAFNKYRYLVRPASHYWMLMELIAKGEKEITEALFFKSLIGHDEILMKFERIFFSNRNILMNEKTDFWMSLNTIYPQFKEYIEKYGDDKFYIVTNKNESAVKTILDYYSIKIDISYLFAKERFTTKESALREIAKENDLSYANILFVDDSPATIEELTPIFPNSYLANWGYYENDKNLKSINSLLETMRQN